MKKRKSNLKLPEENQDDGIIIGSATEIVCEPLTKEKYEEMIADAIEPETLKKRRKRLLGY